MRFSRRLAALAAAALLLSLAGTAAAQAAGSVTGTVVAAESHRPLAGAQVVLQTAPLGILAEGAGVRPLLLGEGLATTADTSGTYRFTGLPAGRYRLFVYALGYRPATLEVRLGGREATHLSVGLRVETVVLQPLVITAEAGNPFGSPHYPGPGDELAGAAERIRQRRFLSSDARAVTRADVQQAVTLGETDLFRALQRLPGVSTRDDYTAELWTRGAPWDQTAVYFDGVPLFNPLHAAGAVSAVSPDAVGALFFHPGVQPAELASGAAGLVDIRTRRGSAAGGGSAELSLVSGRLTADGALAGGRAAWMVAARRSHLDLLSRGVEALGVDSAAVPYAFSDVAGRLDLRIDRDRRLEVSALHEADLLDGEVRGVVRPARVRRGSTAAQVTLALPLLGGELRHTFGASRSAAESEDLTPWPAGDRFPREEPPTEGPYRSPPLDNAVAHLSFGGAWEAPAASGPARLFLGYRLVSQSTRFRTRGLWPYRTEAETPVESEESFRYGVLWGEVDGRLGPKLRLEAGGRVEVGEEVHGSGRARLAPRLSLRYQASPGLSLSAGAAKTIQYARAVVPAGPGYDGIAMSGLFWRLPGTTVPVVSSTVMTAGMEQWLGEGVLLSATAYRRDVEGMEIPDPTPGWLTDRPHSVVAENRAHGLDLSLRRLAGRWTGLVSYAYGVSELEAEGYRFPAPTSRRHAAEVGGMLRVGGGLRAGASYTAASGVRSTRYEWVMQDCDEAAQCRLLAYAREPGAIQAPAYRSLDLLADWSGRVRGLRIGAYAQLRNALGLENPAAYTASLPFCTSPSGEACHPILDIHPDAFKPGRNRFLPGLPFLPFVGVRASF